MLGYEGGKFCGRTQFVDFPANWQSNAVDVGYFLFVLQYYNTLKIFKL